MIKHFIMLSQFNSRMNNLLFISAYSGYYFKVLLNAEWNGPERGNSCSLSSYVFYKDVKQILISISCLKLIITLKAYQYEMIFLDEKICKQWSIIYESYLQNCETFFIISKNVNVFTYNNLKIITLKFNQLFKPS